MYLKDGDYLLGLEGGLREEAALTSINKIATQEVVVEAPQEERRSAIIELAIKVEGQQERRVVAG